ncbi:hypothetical protein NQ317_000692 [Molorchus minor]|uniref:Uncharacterized protein n=1 Tax=Molorchus minor TaxID=1323400 RepID=A0ABQ9JB76_9CUCU|nr:hypothetical protein NQ317_000692 [Molorchus minor]
MDDPPIVDIDDFEAEWEDNFTDEIDRVENDIYSSVNAEELPAEEDQPKPEHLEVLLRSFGHQSFRPIQWKNHKFDNHQPKG